MNIPRLPTDNLYKFMAIFGLILFGGSIYLSILSADKKFESDDKLIILKNQYELDSAVYEFQERISNAKLEKLERDFERDHNEEIDRKLFLEAQQAIVNGSKIIASKEKLNQAEREAAFNKERSRHYEFISNVLMILGSFLIVFGFSLWYYFHQKYIDAEQKWKGEIFAEQIKEKNKKSNNAASITEESNITVKSEE